MISRPIDIKEKNKILSWYKEGESMTEIGRRLGRHHGVIAYHIYRGGLPIRSTANYNERKISTSEIAKMYFDDKMSTTAIGKRIGMSAQGVSERLIREGYKLRKQSETLRIGISTGRIKVKSGADNPNWKGGRNYNSGYIDVRIDKKQIREHRYVWEQHNGKLPKDWVVHHLNGIKDDNRIENLAAMPRKQHNPKKIIEPYQERIKVLENIIEKITTDVVSI